MSLEINFTIVLCLLLILISFFFKLGLVPFHQWLPDIYEGASHQVTAYLAIVTKLPIVVVLINVLSGPFYKYFDIMTFPLLILGCFSMLLGTFAALFQNNLKRILAYSSLNHFGLIASTIGCLTNINIQIIFLYLISYTINMIGIFSIILDTIYLKYKATNEYLKKKNKKENLIISELSNKFNKNSYLGITLAILFLSSAGIPPFGGFFVKFFVIQTLMSQGAYLPCVCIILTSLISAFYYIRLVAYTFFYDSLIFKFDYYPKDIQKMLHSNAILSYQHFNNYESLLTYNISRTNSWSTASMCAFNLLIPYLLISNSMWELILF